MAVLVNFKICDNAKECSGVAVCPTGALTWSDDKESLIIDNDKCIACGLCERECPIGAIRVAKDKEEYEKIKKELDSDPRTTKDLFVDRYGAAPLSEFFMIEPKEIQTKVESDGIVLVECYEEDSIQCLLKSIPIKELTSDLPDNTLFYKVEFDEEMKKKYELKELPSILIFKDGKLVGKVEGYYTNDDKKIVLDKINSAINQL